MHIRSVLSAFLLLVPVASIASEGMIYGAVYECAANEINRAMVEACSSRFPELAKQGDEALAAWRDRNSAKANAAAKACSASISASPENASASAREAVRRLIADTKAEMSANVRLRSASRV
jgi:hypothetical protein